MKKLRIALWGAFVLLILVVFVGTALIARYQPRAWLGGAPPSIAGRADPAKLKASIESFPPFRSRLPGPPLAAMEALVTAKLRELGWEVVPQVVDRAASTSKRAQSDAPPTHNLVATKQRAAAAPFTVLAAHLDSVPASPGADDDGSGVAVLLELARVLSPAAAARTELCFFNEEEDGLVGSSTFVASLSKEDRERLAAAYVMDMVGAYDSRPHSQTYPPPLSWLAPDTGDFLSAISLTEDRAAVDALHAAHDQAAPGLHVELFEPPRAVAAKFRDIWRSDHAPFWEAGLPAVFLTDTGEFRNNRYHTARDTADALDFGRLAKVVDMLAAMQEAAARDSATMTDDEPPVTAPGDHPR